MSSAEQNIDRQLVGIDVDKLFVERMSAKTVRNRPVLTECIEYLRLGDELYVHSINRDSCMCSSKASSILDVIVLACCFVAPHLVNNCCALSISHTL